MNRKDGLKIVARFDKDGIEYYQLIYCYPEEIERTFVELKAVESSIGKWWNSATTVSSRRTPSPVIGTMNHTNSHA